jgi:hypothetical protein
MSRNVQVHVLERVLRKDREHNTQHLLHKELDLVVLLVANQGLRGTPWSQLLGQNVSWEHNVSHT